eukprot:CFRG8326T1
MERTKGSHSSSGALSGAKDILPNLSKRRSNKQTHSQNGTQAQDAHTNDSLRSHKPQIFGGILANNVLYSSADNVGDDSRRSRAYSSRKPVQSNQQSSPIQPSLSNSRSTGVTNCRLGDGRRSPLGPGVSGPHTGARTMSNRHESTSELFRENESSSTTKSRRLLQPRERDERERYDRSREARSGGRGSGGTVAARDGSSQTEVGHRHRANGSLHRVPAESPVESQLIGTPLSSQHSQQAYPYTSNSQQFTRRGGVTVASRPKTVDSNPSLALNAPRYPPLQHAQQPVPSNQVPGTYIGGSLQGSGVTVDIPLRNIKGSRPNNSRTTPTPTPSATPMILMRRKEPEYQPLHISQQIHHEEPSPRIEKSSTLIRNPPQATTNQHQRLSSSSLASGTAALSTARAAPPRVSQTRCESSEPLRLISKKFAFVGAAAKKVLGDTKDFLVVGVIGTEHCNKCEVVNSLLQYHNGGTDRSKATDTDEGITLRVAPHLLLLDASSVSSETLQRCSTAPNDDENDTAAERENIMSSTAEQLDALAVRKTSLLLSRCHVVLFLQPHPLSPLSGVRRGDIMGTEGICWGGLLRKSEDLLASLHASELASAYTGIVDNNDCSQPPSDECVSDHSAIKKEKATSTALHPTLVFAFTDTPTFGLHLGAKDKVTSTLYSSLLGSRWAFHGKGVPCYRNHIQHCIYNKHCPRCAAMEGSGNLLRSKNKHAMREHRFVCCMIDSSTRCCNSAFTLPPCPDDHDITKKEPVIVNSQSMRSWTHIARNNSSWSTAGAGAKMNSINRDHYRVHLERLLSTVLSTPRQTFLGQTDGITWLQHTEEMVRYTLSVNPNSLQGAGSLAPIALLEKAISGSASGKPKPRRRRR